MIRREVPAMRPPLAAFALIACLSLPFGRLDAEKAQRFSRKLPKIEIALSGPTAVKPSESLAAQRYKARLTNRSAEPLVLFVRDGYLQNANWYWTVTDATGWPVGMEFFVGRGFCGTEPYSAETVAAWHRLHDSDIFLLPPGESREFPIPVGPSDNYSFPSAGTYHLSVMLTYVPPNATYYVDARGKRVEAWRRQGPFDTTGYDQWDLSQLSPDAFQTLQNSLSVQGTSSAWNLLLSSRRPARL